VIVYAGCDKQDSLMRDGLCGKQHGGRSQLLFALQQSLIDLYSPAFNALIREKQEWCGYAMVKEI